MDLIRAAGKEPDEHGRLRCVVVVTHDNRIFGYADRIEEMEDGKLKSKPSEFVLTEQHKRHADADLPQSHKAT
jgi:ABC-type lipoprotein export system ATPase subunit